MGKEKLDRTIVKQKKRKSWQLAQKANRKSKHRQKIFEP
jgi:hypothetical protein